jgi:hypothetical protein
MDGMTVNSMAGSLPPNDLTMSGEDRIAKELFTDYPYTVVIALLLPTCVIDLCTLFRIIQMVSRAPGSSGSCQTKHFPLAITISHSNKSIGSSRIRTV